jgi:hypothetical protein
MQIDRTKLALLITLSVLDLVRGVYRRETQENMRR